MGSVVYLKSYSCVLYSARSGVNSVHAVLSVSMLKSMGERTPPCGTPDLNWRFVDEWFLNVVYAMRPLM